MFQEGNRWWRGMEGCEVSGKEERRKAKRKTVGLSIFLRAVFDSRHRHRETEKKSIKAS